MESHDTTVMTWQPPPIRLTSAPHPDLNGGKSLPVFVDPKYIVGIEVQAFSYNKAEDPEKRWPQQVATRVVIGPSHFYFVQEPPEVVAALRDRAFGYAPNLGAV